MAPIKLEDNIREKLQERELAPSQTAWDKLESTLPKQQDKGTNKFFWYAIAASFVGLLVIGSMFFNDKTGVTTTEIVIEEPTRLPQEEGTKNEIVTPKQEEIVPNVNSTIAEISQDESEVPKKTKKVQNSRLAQQKRDITENNANAKTAIAKVSEENKTVKPEDKIQINDLFKKDVVVSNKVDEVVARVKAMQEANSAVTATEIDLLLAQAQREIQTERILNSTKVDAAALLMDVEFDLERSFRDRVFYALGDGFSTIRTAVVERNN